MRQTKPRIFANQVAAEVRAEMARQRLSTSSLAQVLDLQIAAAYRRINGTTDFTIDELDQICDWLGVGVIDIIARARTA